MVRKVMTWTCLVCIWGLIAAGCEFLPIGPDMKGVDRSFEISIEQKHDILQGHYNELDIQLNRIPRTFNGFDFTLGYNATALAFTDAFFGEYFSEECGWEYFTYRFGWQPGGEDEPSGLIRLLGMADVQNGPSQPNLQCIRKGSGKTLMTLKFFTSNDRTFECTMQPVRFYWQDAEDNIIVLDEGATVGINRHIYDYDGSSVEDYGGAFPGYEGCPDTADFSAIAASTRKIDFINGGFEFACADSCPIGDINCNGVGMEIADAIMYQNYFLYGDTVFGDHFECSQAFSDVNHDGIGFTLSDLRHLITIIVGDALPLETIRDSLDVTVEIDHEHNQFSVQSTCTQSLGIMYLVLRSDQLDLTPILGEGADEMDIWYARHGDTMKVLIGNIGAGEIPSDTQQVMTMSVSEPVEVLTADAAGYYARPCKINLIDE